MSIRDVWTIVAVACTGMAAIAGAAFIFGRSDAREAPGMSLEALDPAQSSVAAPAERGRYTLLKSERKHLPGVEHRYVDAMLDTAMTRPEAEACLASIYSSARDSILAAAPDAGFKRIHINLFMDEERIAGMWMPVCVAFSSRGAEIELPLAPAIAEWKWRAQSGPSVPSKQERRLAGIIGDAEVDAWKATESLFELKSKPMTAESSKFERDLKIKTISRLFEENGVSALEGWTAYFKVDQWRIGSEWNEAEISRLASSQARAYE